VTNNSLKWHLHETFVRLGVHLMIWLVGFLLLHNKLLCARSKGINDLSTFFAKNIVHEHLWLKMTLLLW